MAKTCGKTLQTEDMTTVGIVVGERLNSFKNSYVPGHVIMFVCMMAQCSFCSQYNIIPKVEGSKCNF